MVVGGPTGARLSTISLNPSHPSDLFATGPDSSWSSRGAGLDWQSVWLPPWAVFAYDAANPDRVFAGGLGGTVLISNDAGQTWDQHSPQYGGSIVGIGLTGGGEVLAAASTSGVASSEDGGSSWDAPADSGLPDLSSTPIFSFAVAGSGTNVAYLGLQGGGLYATTDADGPRTWTQLPTPQFGSCTPFTIAVNQQHPSTLLVSTGCGLFMSQDSGASFAKLPVATGGGYLGYPVEFAPSNSNIAYAASGNHVVRSTNGGVAWTATADLPYGYSVNGLTIDPSDPNHVYGVTGDGVIETTDGGQTWFERNTGILSTPNVVGSDPAHPNIVYTGTSGGLWRSDDAGATWGHVQNGLPDQLGSIDSIQFPANDPGTIYLGSFTSGYFVSHDDGDSWSVLAAFATWRGTPVTVDPNDPDHLMLGGEAELLESHNGGATWTRHPICCAADLNDGRNMLWFNRVAIDPNDPNVIYVAGAPGVFRSLDGGSTWGQIVPRSCPRVDPLWCDMPSIFEVDPTDPQTIYFALAGGPLRVSYDGGEDWSEIWAETPTSFTLDASTTPATIFMDFGGNWRSTDQGRTWVPGDTPIPGGDGDSMALGDETDVPGVPEPARTLYLTNSRLVKGAFVAKTPTVKFPLNASVPPPRVHVASGAMTVAITCADTWDADCSGRVQLRRRHVVIAVATFASHANASGTVSLHLTDAAWRDLRKHKNRRYNLYAISQGADRSLTTDHRLVVLTVH